MSKFLLLGIFVSLWNLCFSQNTQFKGYMSYPDGAQMGYGYVIFPLSKDTTYIDSTGSININLANPKHRTFYISNGDLKGRVFRFANSFVADTLHRVVIPDNSYYAYYHKIKTCPICGVKKNVLPILYGLPSEKMFKQAEAGRILLGGCIVYDNQPEYYCKKDDFSF